MTKPKNHEFEPADYVGLHLTSHPTKSSADIQFVRPDGTALTVTIPAVRLRNLHSDIESKYLQVRL